MYFCNPRWLSCRADNSGLLFIEERIFLSFQFFSIKSMQYDTCRYTFNLSIGITLEDEEEITVNPRQRISIRPIWKWLLQK